MKNGKIWGETKPILKTPIIEIHHIIIKPHSKCSLHIHQYKWNYFFVLKGKLIIDVHKNNYDLIDRTVLHTNESTTVPPNEKHMFITEELETEALEVYYPEMLSEDIIRSSVGSTLSNNNG